MPDDTNARESWAERAARVGRAALDEVRALNPRRLLADRATQLLPPQTFCRTRTALWRAAGMQIGEQSQIQGAIRVTGAANACSLISIGEFTMITGGLHIDAGSTVTIGSRVRIGHDVALLTISHQVGEEWLRAGTRTFGPIHIQSGCWLASRAIVLPGVTIYEGSIVAAGAVVSRDVPAHSLVAGVPARVIRTLPRSATR